VLVTAVLGGACANAPARDATAHRSEPAVSSADTAAILEAASQKTVEAGSAHVDLWMYVTAGGRTAQVTAQGDMVFAGNDPRKTQVHMTMDLPGASFDGSGGSIEMIVAPGFVFYMKSEAFRTAPGLTTPWIKFDPATLDGRLARAFHALTSAANDPTGSLSFTYGLIDAHRIGIENVDGVTTTHYRATVDLGKALRENPVLRRPAVRKLLRGYRRMLADGGTFPIEIWVDTDGYLKQMDYRLPVAATEGLDDGDVGMTMTLTRIGEPVQIEIPPANEVTDIADLLPGSVTNL
jgi:hypothetical protein